MKLQERGKRKTPPDANDASMAACKTKCFHRLKTLTPFGGCFSLATTSFQPSEDVTSSLQATLVLHADGTHAEPCGAVHSGSALAMTHHLRGALHTPGKVPRSGFFLLSESDRHSPRILEKEDYPCSTSKYVDRTRPGVPPLGRHSFNRLTLSSCAHANCLSFSWISRRLCSWESHCFLI